MIWNKFENLLLTIHCLFQRALMIIKDLILCRLLIQPVFFSKIESKLSVKRKTSLDPELTLLVHNDQPRWSVLLSVCYSLDILETAH